MKRVLLLFMALMAFALASSAESGNIDQDAADVVVGKINAIGIVECTDAIKAKVNDARTAYNALTDAQKALVTESQIKVLTDAEKVFSTNILLSAIVAKTVTYSPIVLSYFKDASCTELNDSYKALGNDEILESMTADGLPDAIQNMVLGIKNGWSGEYNAEWSKRFRIQNYNLYPTAASTRAWEGSLYGDFNSPTGIVADVNQLIYVFVGDNVPANTTLSIVSTNNAGLVGTTETLASNLKKGMNIVLNNRNNAYLWIMYTTADNTVKVSEQNPLKIHIEGGYAMGYADLAGLSETDAQTEYGNMLEYANNLADAKNISKNRIFPVLGNAGEMLFALSAYSQELSGIDIYQSVDKSDNLIMAYHNSLGITDETFSDYIRNYTPVFSGDDAYDVTSLALQLGVFDGTETYVAKADAVVDAYEELGEAQKQTVDPTLVTLVQYAVESIKYVKVVEKINAIGTVAYIEASKAKIDDARDAYDALTDAQKALVTDAQYKVLTDAEAEYESLKEVPTAITDVDIVRPTKTVKTVVAGKIVIIKNGVKYDLSGKILE